MKETCENCKYFLKSEDVEQRLNNIGVCRFNPPSVHPIGVDAVGNVNITRLRPTVHGLDGCGRFSVVMH